jgi:hypothetical protein
LNLTNQKKGKDYKVFTLKKNETSQKFEHHARYRGLDTIFRRRNRESKGFKLKSSKKNKKKEK